MKVLVTGAHGFIGSRLIRAFHKEGVEAHPYSGDLLDASLLSAVLTQDSWDWVIHLAAVSHVPTAEKDPSKAYQVNVAGTALLVHKLRKHSPRTRLLFASTAQVYMAPQANHGTRIIMDESWPIAPQNLYAQTKRDAEVILAEAARSHGLSTTVFRIFNHSHKTQSPIFLLPHLYQQLSTAKQGAGAVEIPVGNLELYRDMGAISDLIEAFLKAVAVPAGDEPFEVFNICSGRAQKLRDLADGMAQRLRVQARFAVKPERVRADEPEVVCGSHERFTSRTGWKPKQHDISSFLDAFLQD